MILDSPLVYGLMLLTIAGISYLVSDWMLTRPKYAFYLTLALFLGFVLKSFLQSSNTSGSLFNVAKSWSVFLPIILFAGANWKYSKSDSVIPKWIGFFFSFVLAANILETIIISLNRDDFSIYIYRCVVSILSFCALFLKWESHGPFLGFKNPVWTISSGICLSYLYLCIFPPGSGIFAFFVLLIAFVPLSRSMEKWFAYRAYSLWCYFIFFFVLDLSKTIRAVPVEIEAIVLGLRESILAPILLGIGVFSALLVILDIRGPYVETKFRILLKKWSMFAKDPK